MFCTECGKGLKPGRKFCIYCGTPIPIEVQRMLTAPSKEAGQDRGAVDDDPDKTELIVEDRGQETVLIDSDRTEILDEGSEETELIPKPAEASPSHLSNVSEVSDDGETEMAFDDTSNDGETEMADFSDNESIAPSEGNEESTSSVISEEPEGIRPRKDAPNINKNKELKYTGHVLNANTSQTNMQSPAKAKTAGASVLIRVLLIVLILLVIAAIGITVYYYFDFRATKEKLKANPISSDIKGTHEEEDDSNMEDEKDEAISSDSVSADTRSFAENEGSIFSSDGTYSDDAVYNNNEDDEDASEEEELKDDNAIHDYELIVDNLNWEEAFDECKHRGGYLLRINTDKEFDVVKEMLANEDFTGVVYLGGMREEDSHEYHWVNADMRAFPEILNSSDYDDYWLDGEPSFEDVNDSYSVDEEYLAMIYVKKRDGWVWNDVPGELFEVNPKYYDGKVAFICEYE